MSRRTDPKLELIGISVENYRSYRKFPEDEDYLKLGRFTTFIGKNDVGKSNLLRAIDIVLDDKSISSDDIHKGQRVTCEITLFFKVPDELKDELKGKFPKDYNGEDTISISKKFEWNNGKLDSRGKYYLNFSKKLSGDNLRSIKNFLPEVLLIPAVKNVEDELKFGRDTLISKLLLPIIEKTSQNKAQTESVADLKRRLTEAIKRETRSIRRDLKKELSKMWSDIEDVTIEVPELKLEKAFTPVIKVKDKYTGKETPITYRGSGMQRYFILSLLEIYREQKVGRGYVLLFEEPEIYLHVGAQKKLCNILQEFAKEGQVIISTHSSIFVNGGDLSKSYLLVKENGETKLRKFTGNHEILEELGMAPSDLFLTDGIIFVEGPSDREILEIFARALFPRWDEYNIAIIPIGGSNIEHQYPKDLMKINPNIAVILDSDLKSESSKLSSNKKKLQEKFERHNIPVYFWKKDGKIVRTIENLFTKKAIKKTFSEVNLESEIGPYDDVPLIIGRELVKIEAKRKPDFDESKLEDDEFCRKTYNKIKHGRKIAKKMVELEEVPIEVKELLENILNKFGIES
ncbi:AAA family ATPase [Thermococcus sp.]|uniref:ATP-dependent nuclease n=1 Tax=Thermococcus sp. TaxID=35749 RepID=UPI002639F97C|nr:AAA family ATPase [Thermococcus sp.]